MFRWVVGLLALGAAAFAIHLLLGAPRTEAPEPIPREPEELLPQRETSPPSLVRSVGPRFHQLLPRDAIAPIYRPRMAAASQAGLRSDELVMGVSINDDSRAYPVGPMDRREMVNDVVGGIPILASW